MLLFLVNVLVGVLAGFLVVWLADSIGAQHRISVILGVIAGILIYFVDFADRMGIH